MDNLLSRHRNLTVLVVVLFAQVVGLAVQVKHPAEGGTVRLIRLWTVSAITPIEKGVVHTREWVGKVWRNYFYLRNVRKENEALRAEIERMRLEQVRLAEDAGQARRLQALLGFKEQFIQQTLPAQVISTTGSEFSHGIYIDKGSRDGLKPDMPVITPEGIVGKVFRVYPTASLVLVINDLSSGVGVILENSRVQGILKGTPSGETLVHNIMADEQVRPGERVLTSGGDRIYPKGLPVGVVASVSPAADPVFLDVRVRPAAQLSRVEEVLVLTKVVAKAPEGTEVVRQRAADILAERLPSVPQKPPEAPPGTAATSAQGTAATAKPGEMKPPPSAPATLKPGTSAVPNAPAAPKESAAPPPTSSGPEGMVIQPKASGVPSALPQKSADAQPAAAGSGAPAGSKPAATRSGANPSTPGPSNGAAGKNAPGASKPEAAKPEAAKPQIPPAKGPPWP